MTYAELYIQKARELIPAHNELCDIDPSIDQPRIIDELVFSRGEYLGGMAAVILELVKRDLREQKPKEVK